MKTYKKMPAVLLAAIAGAGTAHAQSSVTIYGILDAGVEYMNNAAVNGGSLMRLNSGNRLNSRWGFLGKEDLGGGTSAVFQLESGIGMNNGALQQGGRLFGRMAYVGLDNKEWGTLTFGRQQVTMYKFFLPLDPHNYDSYSVAVQDAQFVGRADNSISYMKKFGPLTFNGLYSFGYDTTVEQGGGVPGAFHVGKEYDVGLKFDQGPISAAVAYEERNGRSVASQNDKERRLVIGGGYTLDQVMLYAGGEMLLNDIPTTLAASPPQTLLWAGARWHVTPTIDLAAASYYHHFRTNGSHAINNTIGLDYFLSKRTSLYLNVAYAINGKGAKQSISGASAPISAAGENQFGMVTGIVQRF